MIPPPTPVEPNVEPNYQACLHPGTELFWSRYLFKSVVFPHNLSACFKTYVLQYPILRCLAESCCESHFKVLFQFGDFGAFSMLLCLSIQFLLPKILRSLKLTTACTWKKNKSIQIKKLNMYHFSFHLSCASNLSIVDRQCLSGLCQSLDFCP